MVYRVAVLASGCAAAVWHNRGQASDGNRVIKLNNIAF